MKRKIAALLAVLMLAGMGTGCQETDDPAQDSQTSQSANETAPAVQGYNNGVWYRYHTDLAASPEQWAEAREAADVMVVTRNQLNNATKDDIAKLAALQKEYSVKVALELKGVLASQATNDCRTGKASLAQLSFQGEDGNGGEYAMVQKAIEAGLTFDYILFDNTLPLAMYPNGSCNSPAKRFMSPAEAAMECVNAMQMWGEKFPAAQFIYEADLYNYGWQNTFAYQADNNSEYGDGDLYYQLTMLNHCAQSLNVPLTSILINFPYDYVLGQYTDTKTSPSSIGADWAAVLADIEHSCSEMNLNFGLALASNKSGKSASGSSTRFFAAALRLLNRTTEAGLTADYILYDRGETYPNVNLPDSEDYSYTNALIRLADQFKNGNVIDLKTVPTRIPPVVPANITPTKVWSFDQSTEGWESNHGISDFASVNGALNLTSISGDPYFSTNTTSGIRTSDAEYLYIRYLNVGISADTMQLFFTNGNGGFNEPMSVHFPMDEPSEDESWSEIYVNLRENPHYTGTLDSMRLDPGNTAGKIIIDEIALYNKK